MARMSWHQFLRSTAAVVVTVASLAAVAPAATADPVAEDVFGRRLGAAITASKVFEPDTTLVMVSHEHDSYGDPVLLTSTVNPDGSLVAVWGFPDIRYDFRCTSEKRCWVRSRDQRWQQMSPGAIRRGPVLPEGGTPQNPGSELGGVYDITRDGATTTFTATTTGGPFVYRETITVSPRRLTIRIVAITEDPRTEEPREEEMVSTSFRSLVKPVPIAAPTAVRPGRPTQDSFSVYANPGGAR